MTNPIPRRRPENEQEWRALLDAIFLIRELQGRIIYGAGSPEGVQVGEVGYLYLRTDGGASTTLYVKESGTGDTGWAAK